MAINVGSFPTNMQVVLGSKWKTVNGLGAGSTVEMSIVSSDTDEITYSEGGDLVADTSSNRLLSHHQQLNGTGSVAVKLKGVTAGSAFQYIASIYIFGSASPWYPTYSFKDFWSNSGGGPNIYQAGKFSTFFNTGLTTFNPQVYSAMDAVAPSVTHEGSGSLQLETSSTSGAGYVYTGVAGGGSLQSESPSTTNIAFSSPGNIRTVAALKTLLPLNNAGEVTVQTIKDVLTSVYGIYGSLYVSGGVTAQNFTDTPSKVTMWNGQRSMGLLTDYQNDQITVSDTNGGGYVMLASISCTGDVGTVFQFYFRKDGVELPFGCRVITDANGNANCGVIIGFDTDITESVITMYGESDAGGGKNCTFTDASMVLYRVS